jgi:hypothetical protein
MHNEYHEKARICCPTGSTTFHGSSPVTRAHYCAAGSAIHEILCCADHRGSRSAAGKRDRKRQKAIEIHGVDHSFLWCLELLSGLKGSPGDFNSSTSTKASHGMPRTHGVDVRRITGKRMAISDYAAMKICMISWSSISTRAPGNRAAC